MKKVFTLILALVIGFGLKAQCPLTTAVDFTATDCHGTEIHLFDILDGGQAVLIDFFFTTCGPCQQATPKIAQSYTIMGCNMHDVFYMEISDRDSDAACQTWCQTYGIEYPTISGAAGGSGICNTYQIGAFPTVILIMPDRSIVINDLWPISNAQTIVTQLGQHGLEPHDCDEPVTYDPQVTVSIDGVTESSVTATFTPNEDCASYYYLIATEAEISEWQDGSGGLTEVIQIHGDTETATMTITFNDLLPETEYTILALPVDPDGTFGDVVQETVTTLPQVIIYNPQVTLSVDDVTESSVTATFTPNEDCASYYYLIATEAEILEWLDGLGGLTEVVQNLGETETAIMTITFNDLLPETEYTILALPVDPDGTIGEVVQETVTTLPQVIIYNPQVTIDIEEVTENSITASFTPNEDCASYYYLVATEAEIIAWITMGADFEQIIEEHGGTETATITYTATELNPDTEYKVLALPVDPNDNYGEVVQETVITLLPVIYDETLTFSMDTVNIGENQYQYNWITVYNNTAEEALITRVCDQYEMLAFTLDGNQEFDSYDALEIRIPQGESVELGFVCNIIAKSDILTDIVTLSSNLPDASFVVLVEDPVSVEENTTLVSLFPNPANENVTLKGEDLGTVRVFNMLGQKMDEFEANGNELNINTTGYENGIYVVKTGEATLRFVVKH